MTRAIEPLRKAGTVGHALDTAVTLYASPELLEVLGGIGTDLRAVCIVSQLHLAPLADAPPISLRPTLPNAASWP
ncbi:MAG: hypothetical protein ACLRWP_07790 [Bilophila wadsworthia]